jgi:ATP/maltotriose-dependent transcriptional regulator MalT
LYHGPTPATAAIERCEQILTQLEPYPWAGALALQPLAGLRAMRLDFDEAFRLVDRSMTLLAEYGSTVDAAVSHQFAGVAIMAGRPELAVEHLRTGRRRLARMGERAILASTDGYLAVAQLECGNLRAAARHATICERSAGADDLSAQVTWRRVRARVLAADGKGAAALELAHDAVELANTTDFVEDLTGSHLDLAEVLTASGRATEARAPHAAAVEIANAKEHLAALSALTNQGGHDEVTGQRTASAAKAG